MREILFKGKRPGETEWHYGSLVNIGGICQIAVFDEQEYKSKGKGGWDIFDFVEYITVDASTVCQWTGLYDATKFDQLLQWEQYEFLGKKNASGKINTPADWKGKKVFEWDVVLTPTGKHSVIEYGMARFGLNHDYGTDKKTMFGSWGSEDNLRGLNDGYLKGYTVVGRGDVGGCKIVGNIFDTPELLNK